MMLALHWLSPISTPVRTLTPYMQDACLVRILHRWKVKIAIRMGRNSAAPTEVYLVVPWQPRNQTTFFLSVMVSASHYVVYRSPYLVYEVCLWGDQSIKHVHNMPAQAIRRSSVCAAFVN